MPAPPPDEGLVPDRIERAARRIAAAIEARPKLALTIVAIVLALAGRGARPASGDVADLCTEVLDAAVGP